MIRSYGISLIAVVALLGAFGVLSGMQPVATSSVAFAAPPSITSATGHSTTSIKTTTSYRTTTDDEEADSGNTSTRTATTQTTPQNPSTHSGPDGPIGETKYDENGNPVETTWGPGTAQGEQSAPLFGLLKLGASSAPPAQQTPVGLQQVMSTQVQIQPLGTPNYVNMTLYYTNAQLGALPETNLRMFYFDTGLGAWVELPATVDPLTNSVTVYNVDVSAFADTLHYVGVFG